MVVKEISDGEVIRWYCNEVMQRFSSRKAVQWWGSEDVVIRCFLGIKVACWWSC